MYFNTNGWESDYTWENLRNIHEVHKKIYTVGTGNIENTRITWKTFTIPCIMQATPMFHCLNSYTTVEPITQWMNEKKQGTKTLDYVKRYTGSQKMRNICSALSGWRTKTAALITVAHNAYIALWTCARLTWEKKKIHLPGGLRESSSRPSRQPAADCLCMKQ